jgi:hypothetical protein
MEGRLAELSRRGAAGYTSRGGDMHRVHMLRLVRAHEPAPDRSAKVIALRSRRKARLQRIEKQRPRPDAA